MHNRRVKRAAMWLVMLAGGALVAPAAAQSPPGGEPQPSPPAKVKPETASRTGDAESVPATKPTAEETSEPERGERTAELVVMEINIGPRPRGQIVLELYPYKAPTTVRNFLRYVEEDFYDRTIFHRIAEHFLIQGGQHVSLSMEKIDGLHEPIPNESRPELKNLRGTIAMARGADPDSAQAQFFINLLDNPKLDYKSPEEPGYTVFGRVISGMDIVDEIGSGRVYMNRLLEERTAPAVPAMITDIYRLDPETKEPRQGKNEESNETARRSGREPARGPDRRPRSEPPRGASTASGVEEDREAKIAANEDRVAAMERRRLETIVSDIDEQIQKLASRDKLTKTERQTLEKLQKMRKEYYQRLGKELPSEDAAARKERLRKQEAQKREKQQEKRKQLENKESDLSKEKRERAKESPRPGSE